MIAAVEHNSLKSGIVTDQRQARASIIMPLSTSVGTRCYAAQYTKVGHRSTGLEKKRRK